VRGAYPDMKSTRPFLGIQHALVDHLGFERNEGSSLFANAGVLAVRQKASATISPMAYGCACASDAGCGAEGDISLRKASNYECSVNGMSPAKKRATLPVARAFARPTGP